MTALRTARLTGRPIRASDAGFAAALFGCEQVGRFVAESRRAWTAELAHERALAFAAHWPAHGFGLRVWEAEAPGAGRATVPAGIAGLQFCVLDGRGAVEVSFAFLPAFWGRGLAHEAMAAVLVEAADVSRELEAVAHGDNHRAAALLVRLGFEPAPAPAAPAASGPDMRRYRRRLGG